MNGERPRWVDCVEKVRAEVSDERSCLTTAFSDNGISFKLFIAMGSCAKSAARHVGPPFSTQSVDSGPGPMLQDLVQETRAMPKQSDVTMPPGPPIADPVMRATSHSRGAVPETGFNALVPELDVSDLAASRRFWCELLGFEVAYDRPLARFAYLVRGPIQIMLRERNGNWEVGELSRPFGRGINFQMMVGALAPLLEALAAANWPLFRAPAEAWYRTGDREGGQREFLVQDPDGYLLRFAQEIGTRPPT